MKDNISSLERRILSVVQKGFPETETPFQDIAREIGIDTDELLSVLNAWKEQGKLRRIGAIVNHFKMGLGAGVMAVWKVQPERIQEVGAILAGFEHVSHAYERQTAENWPYNIYTMVHGKSEDELRQTVQQMSHVCGISDYRLLFTDKELKKVPPTYIKKTEQ
ncbi:MAG: siroheme decarboxylase subunit beta [Planctomycetota bacterium]